MNRSLSIFLMLFLCLIPACAPAQQYVDLETREIDVAESQLIFVQVDYGEVEIRQAQGERVTVDGQVLFDDELEYLVDSTNDQISIKIFVHRNNMSTVPLRVTIQVPQNKKVKVETNNASVVARDLQADVEVVSTSGNITMANMTGSMTLRSNRGSITVQESSGDASIVGNYGALTVTDMSGETAASTIMGNIIYSGSIQSGDSARLETDHGAVSVNVSQDSALTLHVSSTSGDVACMLPGMVSTARTCDGEFNATGGDISIRTVSGAVIVQSMP